MKNPPTCFFEENAGGFGEELMPSIISDAAREVGGVLHLPEALQRYPDAGIVLYNRVSSYSNAGTAKEDLDRKTYDLHRQVRAMAPGRPLYALLRGVEKGKLSKKRPKLAEASRRAVKRRAILVAPDLSRLIRSERYDRHDAERRETVPTAKEFAKLHKLTSGAILATVEPPGLTEAERHSKATRRSGRAGRPSKIAADNEAQIFADLGYSYYDGTGRLRYRQPIAKVAKIHGVSKQAILRHMKKPCPLLPGKTWDDWLLEEAEAEGLLEITEDGIVPKVALRMPKRGFWGKRRGRPRKGACPSWWH